MSTEYPLASKRFPRSSRYHPDWIQAGASGGANPLWLTEWLTEAMPLQPGMKVLDLGCGRAMSSVFLRREFEVQVWATDLWFSPSENFQRIQDAGVGDGVFPIHSDARALPFAHGFFDAIVSIDSFLYYGTDDYYLQYLARFLKPGGWIGIAQCGLHDEPAEAVPEALREWWSQEQLWSFHSAAWWRRHWERTGILEIEAADWMPEGWRRWAEWLRLVAPENQRELATLEADAGRHLGYVRVLGRRRPGVQLPEPIVSVPTQYVKQPLLRG